MGVRATATDVWVCALTMGVSVGCVTMLDDGVWFGVSVDLQAL